MAIHCALHHRTSYRYEKPISMGPQVVRLRPAPHNRTPILSHSLKISPQPHFLNWLQDPQGNFLARIVFPEKVDRFEIEVDLVVDMSPINPFDFFLEESAQEVPFAYDGILTSELAPFRRLGEANPGAGMNVLIQACQPEEGEKTNDFLVRVNQMIEKLVRYEIRMDPGVQSPEETLEKLSGSCRDSAWLLVQLLRHLGFAARFVSGYLIQLKADVKPLEGPDGPEEDFTDLHAWAEVYLPGAGWVGMDPTSGLMADEGHIPLAATPDPPSAAPVSGSVGEKVETEFAFDMSVERIRETARVTKPYTEEQWAVIDRLGAEVEEKLAAGDVRLTMGGEPTFVSVEDQEGEEWNTAAMGPTKRELGDGLLRRMWDRFAPGGFLHHGQGKWYPGEQLPRWAFSCHWRVDGEPVWDDKSLFAEDGRDYGHTAEDGETLIKGVARRLEVDADDVQAGYEDTWYYLWRERRLPTNVDPFESKLEDEMERERLARVFERGLESEVGHLLPLGRSADGGGWESGSWSQRAERLYLLPGDSPMGYRLPLESLPWSDEDDSWTTVPLDPSAPREPLPEGRLQAIARDEVAIRFQEKLDQVRAGEKLDPTRVGSSAAVGDAGGERSVDDPNGSAEGGGDTFSQSDGSGEPVRGLPRTALCVEAREGKLRIFMPPLRRLEDYLELVSAVEDTAAELKLPVMLEGYAPPRDPRMNQFSVTPDPGVIEVNVHPSRNWSELVELTRGLYEDAFRMRLGTEKFRQDGTHTGTGGGNHIVVGAATPLDSPFLRRPDLLRSFVSYWHNHPSLSYLFSGGFIGPTSQAPRADEGRANTVYELELAFSQLPKRNAAGENPPWVADRVLRNLLIDLTGNTHRAEFCIDKLYSPDSSTGRLGLLEMRGFEMPPHADMSLAQQLLVRAMVARFWDTPYEAELVSWGTGLHDRFMLPHFLWEDFEDVAADMKRAGFGIDPDWYGPHFEFRFPEIGSIQPNGAWMELRQAIEPWNVLGEEQSSSGTSRYVDSSVERVQVHLRGATGSRHVVSCNGRRVPLHPTGKPGEFVAGVRYRAWAPHSALHPTIPIHAPLTFDLLDTWNGRAVGGCEYHVTHPGGRSYEDYPVNDYAAESRRKTRFLPFGHTPGKVVPPPEFPSKKFPLTLDLQMPVRFEPN